MMKSREMIQENNVLREELTPENKVFYESLLFLIRIRSFLKDEKAVENPLLAILQDLKMAQDAGISAEDYLGRDVGALAAGICQEVLQLSWKAALRDTLICFGIYLACTMGVALIINLVVRLF